MWEKIRNLIRIVIFGLLLVLAISVSYRLLSWKDTTGGYLSATSQLYATEDNLMDVVFLGSSHTYCSISPAYAWENYGYAYFDMAVSSQDRDSTYHCLKEVLKTQSPKVVAVDMYGLVFDKQQIQGNTYRNMLSLKTSPNSIGLVKDYLVTSKDENFDENFKAYVLRWPIVHTRYRELEERDFVTYMPSIYGRGGNYIFEQGSAFTNGEGNEEVLSLNEEQIKWLDSLKNLSTEYGFDLIFFVAPYSISTEEQGLMNGAKEYATNNDITFVDFNKVKYDIGIDNNSDYADANHCNAKGACKVTEYITEVITKECELSDHRMDSSYEMWDEDLTWYKHLEKKNEIKDKVDFGLGKYLADLDDSYICVFSMEGDYSSLLDAFSEILADYELDEDELSSGGCWVYEKGSLNKVHDRNLNGETYGEDIGGGKCLSVSYKGDYNSTNIMIGNIGYTSETNYLTMVVYDKVLEEVVLNIAD